MLLKQFYIVHSDMNVEPATQLNNSTPVFAQ